MMTSSPVKPDLLKLLWTDWLSLIAWSSPLVAWGLYLVVDVLGLVPDKKSNSPVFLYIALAATVLGLLALAWRIRTMQTLFASSVVVPGTITSVAFYRDRGRVEYSYEFSGFKYHAGNALHKTRVAAALQEGDEVALLVNEDQPNRAYIRDLYV